MGMYTYVTLKMRKKFNCLDEELFVCLQDFYKKNWIFKTEITLFSMVQLIVMNFFLSDLYYLIMNLSVFSFSATGKNSPTYASPGPNSGSSFYSDSLLQHDSTPIPPHISGLSFEQQAYLHNLSNPFHQQGSRNR